TATVWPSARRGVELFHQLVVALDVSTHRNAFRIEPSVHTREPRHDAKHPADYPRRLERRARCHHLDRRAPPSVGSADWQASLALQRRGERIFPGRLYATEEELSAGGLPPRRRWP